MIEDIWNNLSEDPLTKGYSFKKIDPPSPNEDTMSECRTLCAGNKCGSYGVTWACPPGVGTGEECLKTVRSFSKTVVLMKKFDNVNFADTETIERISADHQEVCRRFSFALKEEGYRVLPLSDGGCKYCKTCTYPEPCRYPGRCITSVSAYGIKMEEYLRSQNIDFEFRKDSMTLYSLVLYDDSIR